MTDIFISYSSADRVHLEPIVLAFERAGLSMWWDRMIQEGQWGDQTEHALKAARRVVAFVTPRVISRERYYVYAEMQRAQKHRNSPRQDRGIHNASEL